MPAAIELGLREGLRRASDARAAKLGAALGIGAGLAICLILTLS